MVFHTCHPAWFVSRVCGHAFVAAGEAGSVMRVGG